jgi:hypothetical protein
MCQTLLKHFCETNRILGADERGKAGMKSRNLVNRFSPANFCSAIISTAMKLNGLGSHKKSSVVPSKRHKS